MKNFTNKKGILTFVVLFIVLLFLFIAVFYSIPFIKTNTLLISANKSNDYYAIESNNFISKENFNKCRIIDRDIQENEYVNMRTKKKYVFVDMNTVELVCSINAKVNSFDDINSFDEYEKVVTITFSFINNRWVITSVI